MQLDIDSKIQENKERHQSDLNNLRNIQVSYGYIVVYVSFIGAFIFGFIKDIKSIEWGTISVYQIAWFVLLFINLILIGITVFHYYRLFKPRTVYYDKLPEEIYKNIYDEVEGYAKRNDKDPAEEIKIAHLDILEKAVNQNYKLYIKKRGIMHTTIKWAMRSLFLYIIVIITNQFIF